MYSRRASTVGRFEALRAGLKTARTIKTTLKTTVIIIVSTPIMGVAANSPPTALTNTGVNAIPRSNVLRSGEAVLLEITPRCQGYYAQLTTALVNSKPI